MPLALLLFSSFSIAKRQGRQIEGRFADSSSHWLDVPVSASVCKRLTEFHIALRRRSRTESSNGYRLNTGREMDIEWLYRPGYVPKTSGAVERNNAGITASRLTDLLLSLAHGKGDEPINSDRSKDHRENCKRGQYPHSPYSNKGQIYSAQTNLPFSFIACKTAADDTFRVGHHPLRTRIAQLIFIAA